MKRRKEIILALMLLSLFTPHLAGAQRTWDTGSDLSMCLKSVEEIRLYLAGGDDTPIGPGYGKSPIRMPTAYLDGYTFTLADSSHPGYLLQLLDADGVVAYETFVPAGTTTVVLPSTLSGDYELRLVTSTFYFYGYITL